MNNSESFSVLFWANKLKKDLSGQILVYVGVGVVRKALLEVFDEHN
jgi:hypothetical protein